jgi:hypothetical protein
MSQPAIETGADSAIADLPLFEWTERQQLRSQKGEMLEREGSVAQACRILGGCSREALYDLIHSGVVEAYKMRPDKSNSHWRVDLLSCWNHKMRQLGGRSGAGL